MIDMTRLVVLAWIIAVNASAATYFVRAGASGNGTSWASAWSGLNTISWSTVAAGDTVCIAGGTYSSGTTVTKSGTSGSRITVKRATAADATCGSGTTGWNAAYDAQVLINIGNNTAFYWNGSGNYVTVDGVVANGIKITVGSGGGVGFGFDGNVSNVTMSNFEVEGPGLVTYSEECRGVDETPSTGTLSYITVSRAKIHGCPTLMYLEGSNNAIIEYSEFYDSMAVNWSSWHPNIVYWGDSDNGTFRYNKVHGGSSDMTTEGLFFSTSGNSGGPYNVNNYVYGNIFYDENLSDSGRAVESHQCCSWGPLYFYNNTFVNWGYSGLGLRGSATGDAKNNVFINASSDFLSLTHDYNSSSDALGEAHSTTISSSIFANYATYNLHLAADTPVGTSLASTYNTDMDGVTRGADGTWNRGAMEYNSGATGTAPTITTTTLPGGTVGTAYSQTLAATGDAPITWSVTVGSLPDGLSLSGNTISGTPTTAATSNFTVQAANATGSDTQALSIVIAAAPSATPALTGIFTGTVAR